MGLGLAWVRVRARARVSSKVPCTKAAPHECAVVTWVRVRVS